MTKKEFALAVFMVTAITTGASNAQPARDYVTIVGSYVVQPMAMEVAQQFSKTTQAKLPQVQANGAGAGFKSFCAGVDIETPDATTSTRLIRSSELDLCKKNGVTEIVEVRFGYDAIVAAHARGGKVDELNHKEVSVDGIGPTLIAVSRKAYTLTFPLLLYVKKAHINLIQSLKGYLAELTSEKAIGTTGYLYNMGVVPMPLLERNQVRADVDGLKLLPM